MRARVATSKQFDADLLKLNDRLRQRKPFSLVRFGDGEMMIVRGEPIDLLHKYNGEHRYVPGNATDEQHRRLLTESLHFQHPDYFVGIACPCCVGYQHFHELKEASRQSEDQLTWANIFVNSNYPIFLEQTVPILTQRGINLVCHENADPSGLPMTVRKVFRVGANAWVNDYTRVCGEMSDWIRANDKKDEVFIFCAGVLSNLLIKVLTEQHPDNTYLDVGSVFDKQLGLGATRSYLKPGLFKRWRKLNKRCVWA